MMKIECIAVEGYTFGQDGARKGLNMRSNFNNSLKKGKVYIVYAIALFDNNIKYLIFDENEMASMVYADLFGIVDNKIPSTWRCNYMGYNPNGLSLVLGYEEIATSYTHYNGLLELEQKDIELFWKRKTEIDKLCNAITE